MMTATTQTTTAPFQPGTTSDGRFQLVSGKTWISFEKEIAPSMMHGDVQVFFTENHTVLVQDERQVMVLPKDGEKPVPFQSGVGDYSIMVHPAFEPEVTFGKWLCKDEGGRLMAV
jgi:hypothetical protein